MPTLLRAPRRAIAPTAQCRGRPSGRLVLVTEITGVRNFQLHRFRWRDKSKCVAADVNVADGLGDLRHVAGNTRAAGAVRCVVRVLLDAGRMRTILCVRPVAGQANGIATFAHDAGIVGAVRIVTTETRYAAGIHQALHEIVALHTVLVGAAVGKMRERGFAELVLLELPEIGEM